MTVEPPSWSAAAHARNLASAALRMTYRLDVHGAHHLGTSGRLVIVTNCESVLAGAILHAIAPRPVHVVANTAMGKVLRGRSLDASGDIGISGEGAVLSQQQVLAPRPRSRIRVFVFEPVTIDVPADPLWPSTRHGVEERVRQVLADADNLASRRAGTVPVALNA